MTVDAHLQIMEMVGPLLVLKQDIDRNTRRRPTAMMLPLSVLPGLETCYGIPVIRGDRTALLYEAP